MQELFPGYYRPTKEEFSKMWQECIFVFDANVLLNIYRYTPETRQELFDILEQLKERTWLPHQAMLEYHENREEVIAQQHSICDDIEITMGTALASIEVKYRRGHPFADTMLITEIIKEASEKIKASIIEAQSKYPDLLEKDYLLEKITSLFNGKVGSKYPPKRLEEIYKEFEQRFRLQIPPGYRDKNPKKEGFKKYGDGVLWFQLIEYAKSQKKPIILTTDDQKDDWWRIDKGKTLGPRPELVEEISSKTGIPFYMYNASQFMKYAKEYLGFQVRQEAIDEVKDVGQLDEEEYLSEKSAVGVDSAKLINGINASQFEGLSKMSKTVAAFHQPNFGLFEQASKAFETMRLPDFEGLSQAAKAFEAIDTSQFEAMSRTIKSFEALRLPNVKGLMQVAKTFEALKLSNLETLTRASRIMEVFNVYSGTETSNKPTEEEQISDSDVEERSTNITDEEQRGN